MTLWHLNRKDHPAKGIPEKDLLTCILCPNGCHLRYEADGSVSGATCKRGEAYALQERSTPMRTLTFTLRTEAGTLVPVRTEQPIPRSSLLSCAKELGSVVLPH